MSSVLLPMPGASEWPTVCFGWDHGTVQPVDYFWRLL